MHAYSCGGSAHGPNGIASGAPDRRASSASLASLDSHLAMKPNRKDQHPYANIPSVNLSKHPAILSKGAVSSHLVSCQCEIPHFPVRIKALSLYLPKTISSNASRGSRVLQGSACCPKLGLACGIVISGSLSPASTSFRADRHTQSPHMIASSTMQCGAA